MTIHGKEYNFLLTTGAVVEIAELCPDNDIGRIREILKNKISSFSVIAKMAAIMSKWYELVQAFNAGGYNGIALTAEECLSLPMDEFQSLTTEVMTAFSAGQKTTVETEPVKKKEESGTKND